jgi:hypothetical protein
LRAHLGGDGVASHIVRRYAGGTSAVTAEEVVRRSLVEDSMAERVGHVPDEPLGAWASV